MAKTPKKSKVPDAIKRKVAKKLQQQGVRRRRKK